MKVFKLAGAVLSTLCLSGCFTDYANYAKAHSDFAKVEALRMERESAVVMQTASLVLSSFSRESKRKPVPLYQKTTRTIKSSKLPRAPESCLDDDNSDCGGLMDYLSDYLTPESAKSSKPLESQKPEVENEIVTEVIYDNSAALVDFLISQQQTKILEVILPIIRGIYKQQQLNISAPVDAGSVALALINNIPFMTSMASMYGLGKAGIENAGDRISAVVSSGGSITTGGTPTGSYSEPTTTSITTRPLEEDL